MKKIYTHSLNGKDIDILFENGYVAYTFVHEGKNYGNKVKPEGKKTVDLVNATFQLITNAIETMDALKTQ